MLELVKLAEPIDHAEAFGRIAFSCPRAEVHTHTRTHTHTNSKVKVTGTASSKVREAGGTVLTPLVSLDTPGKATVEVVILVDPVSEPDIYLHTSLNSLFSTFTFP